MVLPPSGSSAVKCTMLAHIHFANFSFLSLAICTCVGPSSGRPTTHARKRGEHLAGNLPKPLPHHFHGGETTGSGAQQVPVCKAILHSLEGDQFTSIFKRTMSPGTCR